MTVDEVVVEVVEFLPGFVVPPVAKPEEQSGAGAERSAVLMILAAWVHIGRTALIPESYKGLVFF